MRSAVPVFLVAVLVAAGCGARSSKPYTAAGTVPCLTKQGFAVTREPAKIGFIAAVAENGGLQARSKTGNVVTIAFTKDETTVSGTESAFRRSAPPRLRPHMGDVMSANRNAVLVWTVTPTSSDSDAVAGCLAP